VIVARKGRNKADANLDSSFSGCSKKRTVVNILKSYVGAGVLAIPYAFAQGGLIVREERRVEVVPHFLAIFVLGC